MHYGNDLFQTIIEKHQTSYLCAKRSDKQMIAMKIMDEVKSRGGKFVRRVKTARKGNTFGWEDIGEKRAYEKVCQALRDCAPELRRRMMTFSKRVQEDYKY